MKTPKPESNPNNPQKVGSMTQLVRLFDPPCLLPPRKMRLWGQESEEQVALCETILGDGEMLLAVQPLATRPTYYLIRVDSKWATSNYDEGETVGDHMDEIYEAIEDDYGQLEVEDDNGEMIEQPWPALDCGYGSSWWDADPEDYLPNAKRIRATD